MDYTKSQVEAIEFKGKNVLVSASAGSGKTGVLKERVIQKLKNGVDIDQLVILTFTEAAALEMKSRIVSEIHKENLVDQIDKVDNAIISTFDAFTLRLVKEYHYLLGLDNNIGINDQVIIKSRKQEIIEEVLKGYYLDNSPEFNLLFKRYFSKSDYWLGESVYLIGEAFRKMPNYFEVIENYDKLYLADEFLNEMASKYVFNLRDQIKALYPDFKMNFINHLESREENYQEYLVNLNGRINEIFAVKNQEDLFYALLNPNLPTKPRKSELVKPEIAKEIEDIKKEFNDLFLVNYEDLVMNFNSAVPSIKVLLDIVSAYLKEFENIKLKESLFSFEDIMFLAIKLFKEFSDVKRKFKSTIKEILVDEYQDTNDLQDEFIKLIANENIFMVGDVKQSIYRFRDANPKNFMRIYEDYINTGNGKAIFLQENFRSNRFVLKSINEIFTKIMTKNVGGVDYSGEQVLITGFKENFPLHVDNALELKLYDLEKIKEDYPSIQKPEIEAHLLALDIKNRISSNDELFDLKRNVKRKLNYEDITILVAHKSDFLTISKVLSQYNIPIDLYDDEPFFSSDEISFIFQYLILINCFRDREYFKKYFKTSLYAVARSFVYKVKDQAVSELFTFEKFDELCDLERLSSYKEFQVIYSDINDIISSYWDFPPSKILEAVYDKCHIYKNISLLDNPRKKEEKLDFFLAKVKSFSNFTYSDLIKYLELIIETSDFDIQYAEVKKNVNAVKLMSMHKSKGLQFPVVYLIGLYKKFLNMENKEAFIFHKDYGILTKAFDDGFYPNFMQRLFFKEVEKENLSERIRLLYVAMTRAINKVVLVLDFDESLVEEKKSITSFKNIIYQTLPILESDVVDFSISDLNKNQVKLEKTSEVIDLKKFDFPREKREVARYSKTIVNLVDDEIKNIIDVGIEYHQLLEMIDYNSVEESIKDFPFALKKSISTLINTELFKGLINPKFYQEYEFYQESERVNFRGVIDLLIIDEDMVYALDYKLKNIEDIGYRKQLIGYYEYLKDKVDKPIKLFLYSLHDELLKEVIL